MWKGSVPCGRCPHLWVGGLWLRQVMWLSKLEGNPRSIIPPWLLLQVLPPGSCFSFQRWWTVAWRPNKAFPSPGKAVVNRKPSWYTWSSCNNLFFQIKQKKAGITLSRTTHSKPEIPNAQNASPGFSRSLVCLFSLFLPSSLCYRLIDWECFIWLGIPLFLAKTCGRLD